MKHQQMMPAATQFLPKQTLWKEYCACSTNKVPDGKKILNSNAFGNELYQRHEVECEMLVGANGRQMRVHIPSIQYTQYFDAYELAAQLNDSGIMNFSILAVIDFLIDQGMLPYPVEESL